MKKLILTFLLILTAQLSSAQEVAFKADCIKVIRISGATAQMETAKKQIMGMISEEKHDAFGKEFDAYLPSLYDKMADIYMAEYSHEDIKAMISFYESTVGKKMSGKAGTILEKSMAAGQEWGMELQEMMGKYMD